MKICVEVHSGVNRQGKIFHLILGGTHMEGFYVVVQIWTLLEQRYLGMKSNIHSHVSS